MKLAVPATGATQSATACAGAGTYLPGGNNQEIIWNFLLSKGLSPTQIAGFMGNLKAEAHFEPRLVQYGKKNPDTGETSKAGDPSSLSNTLRVDGQTGYGIAQWTTSGRQQNLVNFAAAQLPPTIVGDLTTQLNFLWEEMNGSLKSVLEDLRDIPDGDVRGATHVILYRFECPRPCVNVKENRNPTTEAAYNKVLDDRTGFANSLLGELGSLGGV